MRDVIRGVAWIHSVWVIGFTIVMVFAVGTEDLTEGELLRLTILSAGAWVMVTVLACRGER